MSGEAYIASDDSALLRSALHGLSGARALEIGAGNGGNLIELAKGFGLVVGTDLVRPADSDWKEQGVDFVLADGASCVRPGTMDLVAFNPPYLAEEASDDRAVEGGVGLEVPKAFLREALRTVKDSGRVVFLLNDAADIREFEEVCAEKAFALARMATKRVFFEELAVYSAAGRQRHR
jgi:methylase of polypeptide subunit release factors